MNYFASFRYAATYPCCFIVRLVSLDRTHNSGKLNASGLNHLSGEFARHNNLRLTFSVSYRGGQKIDTHLFEFRKAFQCEPVAVY